jgi:hypothetical protein
MVFIKTEMVPPLKFHSKLNETPHHHQSHWVMCSIIIIFLKKIL